MYSSWLANIWDSLVSTFRFTYVCWYYRHIFLNLYLHGLYRLWSIELRQSSFHGNHFTSESLLLSSFCFMLYDFIMVKTIVNAGTMLIYLLVGIKVPAVLFPITFALRWSKKEKSYQNITMLRYSQVIWGMPVPLCNRIWTAYLSQWRICQWLWRRGYLEDTLWTSQCTSPFL